MKKLSLIALFSLLLITLSYLVWAETITLTTYYPAPYGVYKEMRAKRMAIGDTYYDGSQYCWEGTCTTTIDSAADLIVEGNVGIGTASPAALLELKGDPTGGKFVTLDRTENAGISNKFDIGVGATGGVDLMYLGKTYGDMVIRSDGNVGIGTTSPGASLEVSGDIIATGMSKVEVGCHDFQALATSAYTTVVHASSYVDTLSEYNHSTGVWTATHAGTYVVAWTIYTSPYLWTPGTSFTGFLSKNNLHTDGNSWTPSNYKVEYSRTISATNQGSAIVTLEAGDNLRIKVWHNAGGTVYTHNEERYTYLHIARIP